MERIYCAVQPEGRTSAVREIGEGGPRGWGLQSESTEDIRCDSQAGPSRQRLRLNVNMSLEEPVILKWWNQRYTRKTLQTQGQYKDVPNGQTIAYLQFSVLQRVFQEEAQIRLLCLQRLELADCRTGRRQTWCKMW